MRKEDEGERKPYVIFIFYFYRISATNNEKKSFLFFEKILLLLGLIYESEKTFVDIWLADGKIFFVLSC
jgi:hypothetical protein